MATRLVPVSELAQTHSKAEVRLSPCTFGIHLDGKEGKEEEKESE